MTPARYLPDAVRSRYAVKLFLVSLVVVTVIVGVGVVTAMQVSERVTDEQLDSMEASAELEAQALGQWIDGQQETVRLLSNHQGVDPDDIEGTRATLRAELAAMPDEAAHLYLVERTPEAFSEGRNETILASTDREFEGEPLSATNIDWNPDDGFNFATESDTLLSWVYIDDGEPSVAIASPTPDGEHVLVADYRTNVRAEEFTSTVEGTDTVVLGGFTAFVLFDENESNVMTRYKGDRRDTTIGSEILDSEPYARLNGSVLTEDSVKGYHSVPGEDVDWVVVKEAPQSTAMAVERNVRSDLVVLILLTFVGFVLVGITVQRGPIRAIQRLAERADAIAEGDLSVEIEDEGRVDELGDVRSGFRNTKEYVETITKQSEALSRREFDADILEEDIPGRVGETMEGMRTDLEQFIADIEEERERYSTLVEQSSDGVAVVRNGEYVFVNDRFVEISGYDRETLLGMAFEEVFTAEYREVVLDRYERRVAGESPPGQYDLELENPAGEVLTLEVAVSRIDHEGEPATLATFRDVTERKRREGAVRTLQDATERIQDADTADAVAERVVEAASDVLDLPMAVCWVHDEETDRLAPAAATDAAREAGLVSELSADRYEFGAFRDGDVKRYTPSDHAAGNPLETGVLLPLGEYGLVAAGRHEPVEADEVVLDVAGALAEHATTALDRVERAREVRESERRFRLIAERIDEVIFLASAETSETLYVNTAYEDVWGRPSEELYDDPRAFVDAVDPRDREAFEREFEDALAAIGRDDAADSYEFEYRIRRPDGEVRWLNGRLYPVELAGGDRRFVGITEDITERKRREQRLEVFNRVLRHNLRNQVDVIRSHAEFLAARTDGEHAARIVDSVDSLAAIGNRARRIDRFMSREIREAEVDLADVAREVLDGVDPGETDVATRLPESAPLVTDRDALAAVLESALENAVAYAEESVTVSVGERADGYLVTVDDDGPGIPAAELAPVDAGTETDLEHGRGLGLWQLKWGIEKLNGDLSFETGDGTTVRIRVPDRGSESA